MQQLKTSTINLNKNQGFKKTQFFFLLVTNDSREQNSKIRQAVSFGFNAYECWMRCPGDLFHQLFSAGWDVHHRERLQTVVPAHHRHTGRCRLVFLAPETKDTCL